MAWFAATFHNQLDAGTELAIFQEPWDPEEAAPKQFPASVDLRINFPDGAAVVWVRDVSTKPAVVACVRATAEERWHRLSLRNLVLFSFNRPFQPSSCASLTSDSA
jgi:hypothetical protein